MDGIIDENRVREIVREELINFSPSKKKRAPNKWQTFLKNCTKEQPEELDYMGKVKACSVIYKDKKSNGESTNNSNNSQPKPTTNGQEQKSDDQNNSNKGDK